MPLLMHRESDSRNEASASTKGKKITIKPQNQRIMHGKIFQITQEKPSKENFLNENTLNQGDGNYYDYCSEIRAGYTSVHRWSY